MRRWLRRLLVAAGVLLALAAVAYALSGDVRYLVRAGLEEARILWRRRPLAEVVADPGTPADTRALLGLVLEARDFAASLGYEAGETYTTWSDVGRDTLLLVLSAAPRDCICPYTWTYPIVGEIPYKGFFDAGMARSAAEELADRGYDVYLRPASAFSTLGWFNDPLLSTALARDSVELAALVFHETAHNTLWVPGAVAFNETFAQFAGYRAAEAFFRARGDTLLARRAADRLHDEQVLGEYYAELTARLTRLYAAAADSAAVEAARAAAGRWARHQLEGPVAAAIRTFRIGPVAERPVNNARLIGALLYRTRLDLFDRWHAAHGGRIGRSVAALDSLLAEVPGDSAFQRLARAVGDSAAAVPGSERPACCPNRR